MSLKERLEGFAQALDVDPGIVERDLEEELAAATRALDLVAVPEADRDALTRTDTPVEPSDGRLVMPWLRGEAAWERMRATAVSITDAAARLKVSGAALRRVLGTSTGHGAELLGTKDSRGAWRVFAYQLPDAGGCGGEPSTGQGRRAQRELPPAMHPVAVQAWWDVPNAALYIDGEELAPRTWLTRGLDPDRVIDAARDEDAE